MMALILVFSIAVSCMGKEAQGPRTAMEYDSIECCNQAEKLRTQIGEFRKREKSQSAYAQGLSNEIRILKAENPGFRYLKFEKSDTAEEYAGGDIFAPYQITGCSGKSATIEIHDPATFNLIKENGVGQIVSEGQLVNAKIAGSQIAGERICGDSNEVHNWNVVRIETDAPIDCGKSGRSYFIPGKPRFAVIKSENKVVNFWEVPIRRYKNIFFEWINEDTYRIREDGVIIHEGFRDYNGDDMHIEYLLTDSWKTEYLLVKTPRKLSTGYLLIWKKEGIWNSLMRSDFSPRDQICDG